MDLDSLRKQIDELDREIIDKLNQRAEVAQGIGRVKASIGKAVFDPRREEEVFRKVLGLSEGPIKDVGMRAIYREIISACSAVQRTVRKIAYLGPEATYTHQAAVKQFGASSTFVAMPTIHDVFAEVDAGDSDFGVIPIENSTEGVVFHSLHSFDILVESDLKIVSQVYLPISHSLISRSPMSEIRTVYSKDQAIAQCREWLRRHLPHAELKDLPSTTQAVQKAAEESGVAAIASKLAAEMYQVPVVSEGIQDLKNNITRFLVIGHEDTISKPMGNGQDKTSFVLSIPDSAGALQQCLEPFSRRGISLSKIESRPSRKKAWEYLFFVDVIGHFKDAGVEEAYHELEEQCPVIKWLGSYPNVVE